MSVGGRVYVVPEQAAWGDTVGGMCGHPGGRVDDGGMMLVRDTKQFLANRRDHFSRGCAPVDGLLQQHTRLRSIPHAGGIVGLSSKAIQVGCISRTRRVEGFEMGSERRGV